MRLSLTLVESGRQTSIRTLVGLGGSVAAQVALACTVVVLASQVVIVEKVRSLTERPTFLAPLLQERPRPVQEKLTYTALGGVATQELVKTAGITRDAAPARDLVVSEIVGGGDDLSASQAHETDFSPVFSEIEVDSAASRDSSSAGPEYPPSLMSQGKEGSVLATFIVDTTGRPDLATYIALESSHPLFSLAVRDALPKMKFRPAKRGNTPVRQQVELRFSFRVVKAPAADSGKKKPAKKPPTLFNSESPESFEMR